MSKSAWIAQKLLKITQKADWPFSRGLLKNIHAPPPPPTIHECQWLKCVYRLNNCP